MTSEYLMQMFRKKKYIVIKLYFRVRSQSRGRKLFPSCLCLKHPDRKDKPACSPLYPQKVPG